MKNNNKVPVAGLKETKSGLVNATKLDHLDQVLGGDECNSILFSGDCVQCSLNHIKKESIDVMLCDPPFGLEERKFNKHYNRNHDKVVGGYKEAPPDYYKFSLDWITEAKRILKKNGAMYIVSGWTNLGHIINAVQALDLNIINHIIWKFSFGVNTERKFVTSHYHILYISKSKKARHTFNNECRYSSSDKSEKGGSALYADKEDVWYIKKEYKPGQAKNMNKLPEALIKKMIEYSSNPGDLVCDFFMGNYTTATVAKKLGRYTCGVELNEQVFDCFVPKLNEVRFGCDLKVYENLKRETETYISIEEEKYRKYFHSLLKQGVHTYVDGRLHGRFNVTYNAPASSKKGFNWKGQCFGQGISCLIIIPEV